MSNNISQGFYFELSFLEGHGHAFQEVSGIKMEIGKDEITSDDENQHEYSVPSASGYQNLIVKRGILPTDSLLLDWCASIIGGNFSNPIQPQNLVLSLLDSNGLISKKWLFYNAYPVKYAVSDFQPLDGAIAAESIEFAYTYFEVMK